MAVVRVEQTEDHDAISEIHRIAFGGEDEARLVEALRESEGFIPELSLVARERRRVIGHVLFSPISIESPGADIGALALAPIGVHPDCQGQGIGSSLIEEGLVKSEQLGYGIVIVIGEPGYYHRFGFEPAGPRGLECPFAAPDEAFMVLELVRGALDDISGIVRYPPEFM